MMCVVSLIASGVSTASVEFLFTNAALAEAAEDGVDAVPGVDAEAADATGLFDVGGGGGVLVVPDTGENNSTKLVLLFFPWKNKTTIKHKQHRRTHTT